MFFEIHLIFKVAVLLYTLSFGSLVLSRGKRSRGMFFLLFFAVAANGLVIMLRYWSAWPMLPMYLGPVALPLVLGLFALFLGGDEDWGRARVIVLFFTVIIGLAAAVFPKDFYLPFIKSKTLFSHLFFFFGLLGKGCFFMSAAWAFAGLRLFKGGNGDGNGHVLFDRSMGWAVWGFAFWTLSMFSGELWSYLGWGSPVVWEDPAITTTMGTWFFYVCLLHLHLTGTWSPRSRGAFAALGALVVFGLNILPDLGPFRRLF